MLPPRGGGDMLGTSLSNPTRQEPRLVPGGFFHRAWGNMGMPIFKATFLFRDDYNSVGWTHSWWTNAPDYTTANTQVYPYWQKLRVILMTYVFLQTIRISNVDPPRDSLFFPPNALDLAGTIDATTNPGLGYTEALLVRRDATTPNVFAHLFIHGMSAKQFSGRSFTPDVGTQASFDALKTEVTNGTYLIRKKTAVGPPAVYTTFPCTFFIPMRLTSHRVGRPTDPLRGKRRIA